MRTDPHTCNPLPVPFHNMFYCLYCQLSSVKCIATFVTGGTTPTLRITGVTISGWDSTGKAVYGTMGSIDPDKVKFVAATYDLDGNGKVDQVDITVAQAAYQARSNEGDWDTPGANGVAPSACDVTGDGVVDIQDLIAIYLNFTA